MNNMYIKKNKNNSEKELKKIRDLLIGSHLLFRY